MNFSGCFHKFLSFPMKPRGEKDTYVVCLDCGRHFPYDWEKMKVVKSELVAVGEEN